MAPTGPDDESLTWDEPVDAGEIDPVLRTVVETTTDAVLAVDATGAVAAANGAAADVFGYAPEELVGMPVESLFPESLQGPLQGVYAPGGTPGVPFDRDQFDVPGRHADGQQVALSGSFRSVPDSELVVGVLRDHGSRRTRERAQYEKITETVQDGICVLNADSEFRLVNEAFCEMTGYARDALLGSHASLVRPAALDEQFEAMQTALAGGSDLETIEMNIETADGETRAVEARYALFRWDEEVGRVGVWRDVTRRTERERELARFERAVEAMGHAIYMTDTEGRITYVNPAMEEITGYAEAEVLGETPTLLQSGVHDDAYYRNLWETVLSGEVWSDVIVDERKSGEQYSAEQTIAPVVDEDGTIDRLVAVHTDISDLKRYESRLTALQEASRELLAAETAGAVSSVLCDAASETLPLRGAAVYVPGGASHLRLEATSGAAALFETQPAPSSAGGDVAWRAFESDETVVLDDLATSDLSVAEDGVRSGAWLPLGEHGVLVALSSEPDCFDADTRKLLDLLAAAGVTALDRATEEAERRRRETRLEALTAAVGDLIEAESRDAVAEVAVETAASDLGFDVALVGLYDEDVGELSSVVQTALAEDVVDEASLLQSVSGVAWESFVGQGSVAAERIPVDDAAAVDAEAYDVAVFPMGTHGVLVVGTLADVSDADAVPSVTSLLEATTQPALVKILANNTRASLDAVARAKQLEDRESVLRERTDRLERVNHINDVIRRIDQELITAESRRDVEEAVCTQLTVEGPYAFAWIAEYDIVADRLEPTAWAGAERGYLDAISVLDADLSELGPTGEAIETRRRQVVDDLIADPPFPQWRREALERRFGSCIAIPLLHDGVRYGVLTVFAESPDTFDEMERDVLTELGAHVAYIVNVVEMKRGVLAERVVELELETHEPDDFMNAVARAADEPVSTSNIVAGGTDRVTLRFRIEDAPVDRITDLEDTFLEVYDVEHVPTENGDDFRATVSTPTVATTAMRFGATPRSIDATPDRTRLVVALPETLDVREFVARFRTRYPDTELVARREPTEQTRTPSDFLAHLEATLTERQYEVLETAFRSGYFEWPRESTGEDVADRLGVSQPTVNRHLREGLRRMLTLVYGDSESLPGSS